MNAKRKLFHRLSSLAVFSLVLVLSGVLLSGAASAYTRQAEYPNGKKSITTTGDVVKKLTGKVTIDYPKPAGKDMIRVVESSITVSGQCPANSIVTIYDNNTVRGSVKCVGGRYSIVIQLFLGKNELQARAVDELGEGDLVSNIVYVYREAVTQGCEEGDYYLLPVESVINGVPGNEILRHVIVVGGTAPYKMTWNWGDGKTDTTTAVAAGQTMMSHRYDKTGIYNVTITATDKNGVSTSVTLISTIIPRSNLDLPGRLLGYWPLLVLAIMLLAAYLWGHHEGRVYERREHLSEEHDLHSRFS